MASEPVGIDFEPPTRSRTPTRTFLAPGAYDIRPTLKLRYFILGVAAAMAVGGTTLWWVYLSS